MNQDRLHAEIEQVLRHIREENALLRNAVGTAIRLRSKKRMLDALRALRTMVSQVRDGDEDARKARQLLDKVEGKRK